MHKVHFQMPYSDIQHVTICIFKEDLKISNCHMILRCIILAHAQRMKCHSVSLGTDGFLPFRGGGETCTSHAPVLSSKDASPHASGAFGVAGGVMGT